jgi:hypothetical protein
MAENKYSIELHENAITGKTMRLLLGLACLAVSVWFMYSIRGTAASVGTSWIATGFLLMFGIWMIATGLGYTERYVTIGDDRIVLRQYFYKKPVTFASSTLRAVEFRPVAIDFITQTRKITLRMGTTYPERTASIMEAVKQFCLRHGIEVIGAIPGEQEAGSGG